MRVPIIAGNWKMNKGIKETRELLYELKRKKFDSQAQVVICPPFTSLTLANEIIKETSIALGAQNMHWEKNGAYTGEISPDFLKETGCEYVIIGHSERRQLFGEKDAEINKKVKAAIDNNITPIICVGENIEERKTGKTNDIILKQVKNAINGVNKEDIASIVIAYEPIWAIGTGESATGNIANDVVKSIREFISQCLSNEAGDKIRILYGGSVKPKNINEFMEQKEIDGALVGGASLKTDDFIGIIEFNGGSHR